jgi:divalent anion:Na+ symporter, DASS family
MKRAFLYAFPLLALMIWFFPTPVDVNPNGYKLLAIFVATVLTLVLKLLPMGVAAITALTVATTFGVLPFSTAFSGFSNDVSWLIVLAFFLARGLIITGLGARVAYKIMSLLGKNTLGLGYGLVATELMLAPAIPSMTARSGGIIYPVVKTLAAIFTGRSHDPRMGGFLSMTAFQGSVIASAMFLTAMAGNPLMLEIAKGQGIYISWTQWMLAALVPGMISLLCIPYLIYKLCAPSIRQTPDAKEMAMNHLRSMGKMQTKEWIVASTFAFLIICWIIGLKPTIVALFGLVIFLFTKVLSWKEVLEETSAWDTFVWFSTFIALSNELNHLGVISHFSSWVSAYVSTFEWVSGLLLLSLIYFYAHYFFASNTAHIGAMYTPFLVIAIAIGAPKMLAVLLLAFFSSLFGGLTQYGSGPAPIFFGAGYVSVSTWWKIGFIVSLANIFIWIVFGGLWWKLLGFW